MRLSFATSCNGGARAKIEISETRGSLTSRTFWVTTTGLADALNQLQKRCDARKDIAMPAADRLR